MDVGDGVEKPGECNRGVNDSGGFETSKEDTIFRGGCTCCTTRVKIRRWYCLVDADTVSANDMVKGFSMVMAPELRGMSQTTRFTSISGAVAGVGGCGGDWGRIGPTVVGRFRNGDPGLCPG